MSFKIVNWKLALLALIFISLFTSLGTWQVLRAQEKKALLVSFQKRTVTVLKTEQLGHISDKRFYQAALQGKFENQYTFLLDNKISHGKVGYEIFTAFRAQGLDSLILVDRGFVPIKQNRNEKQPIATISGQQKISGMLNLPPKYVALGAMADSVTWPLRIEYVDLAKIADLLHEKVFPYILSLDPNNPYATAMDWQIVTVPPERHLGYAVQWFALALTLLILSVVLNRR